MWRRDNNLFATPYLVRTVPFLVRIIPYTVYAAAGAALPLLAAIARLTLRGWMIGRTDSMPTPRARVRITARQAA